MPSSPPRFPTATPECADPARLKRILQKPAPACIYPSRLANSKPAKFICFKRDKGANGKRTPVAGFKSTSAAIERTPFASISGSSHLRRPLPSKFASGQATPAPVCVNNFFISPPIMFPTTCDQQLVYKLENQSTKSWRTSENVQPYRIPDSRFGRLRGMLGKFTGAPSPQIPVRLLIT